MLLHLNTWKTVKLQTWPFVATFLCISIYTYIYKYIYIAFLAYKQFDFQSFFFSLFHIITDSIRVATSLSRFVWRIVVLWQKTDLWKVFSLKCTFPCFYFVCGCVSFKDLNTNWFKNLHSFSLPAVRVQRHRMLEFCRKKSLLLHGFDKI